MRQGIGLQSYKAIPSCLDNISWCMARLQAVQARACFQQLLEFHEHMRMGNGQTCMAAERCCVHACLPRTYDVHSCACVLSSGGCSRLQLFKDRCCMPVRFTPLRLHTLGQPFVTRKRVELGNQGRTCKSAQHLHTLVGRCPWVCEPTRQSGSLNIDT